MAGIQEYRCPFCGSMIVFDDFSHIHNCPYCGSKISVNTQTPQTEVEKQQVQRAPQPVESKKEVIVTFVKYKCESCQSTLEMNEEKASHSCPYCGEVMQMQSKGEFDSPDFIVPFKQSKEDAKRAFQAFVKGKSLLPDAFTKDAKMESMQGVFIPYWIFDYDMNGKLNYQATKSTYWNDDTHKFSKKEEYQVLREGFMEFESIQLCASSKIKESFLKAIGDFDLQEAMPFESSYTSNFSVQSYDVEFLDTKKKIENKMADCIMKELEHTVTGYQTRNATTRDVEIADLDINYVLFPMWILSTSYKGKAYTFIMNGQTGKWTSEIAIDKKKYWIHFGLYFIVTFLVVLLIAMLIQ